MPAKMEMTWEATTCRWKKIYKGKAYTVSCRVLGVPSTKYESYHAANAWWLVKKAEIDAFAPPHPHAERLAILSRKLSWARQHGEISLAQSLEIESLKYEKDTAGELLEVRAASLPLAQFVTDQSHEIEKASAAPSMFAELVVGTIEEAVWNERLTRDATTPTNRDRTIGTQVERYLSLERVRVESNMLSVGEFDTIRRCLYAFRDWNGSASLVDCLNADKCEGWWSYLLSQPISVEYKKKQLRIARCFIAWLAEKGQIPLPPNLHSRRHRFGGGAKAVATLPVHEVGRIVSAATGQLKLHLLLMINCGMTQVDIAELHPSEVDWKRGKIKRKRSKTESHENVPTVEYPLWPETCELLQKFGNADGDRVLLTESGRPWLRDELRSDGKRSKVDAIKSNYIHLQKKLNFTHPMKLLRKTSASLLETHQLHARYAPLFLGHAPKTVAERHYVVPSQTNFDEAVEFLRCCYAF